MKAIFKIFAKVISFSFFCLVFLTACSTTRPVGETEAEVLFKEASQLMEKGRYIMANEKLNALRSQFPYSFYSTPAELMQADILFKQENYVESAAAYLVFKDFHPKHKDMVYVIGRIADSFFYQMPSTFDRDLTPGVEAMKHYSDLLKYYPDSDYTKDAAGRIAQVKDMLESKEIYIADFYFKTGDYEASRARYLDLARTLSKEEQRQRSMLRSLEASYELKDLPSCEKYYDEFSTQVDGKTKNSFNTVLNNCKKLVQ